MYGLLSTLDDDVNQATVGRLLAATDALMLPRQKSVQVTEDLVRYEQDTEDEVVQQLLSAISAYWGGERRQLAAIGFSSRVGEWPPTQIRAVRS